MIYQFFYKYMYVCMLVFIYFVKRKELHSWPRLRRRSRPQLEYFEQLILLTRPRKKWFRVDKLSEYTANTPDIDAGRVISRSH